MYYKHRYNLIRFDLSTTGTAYKLFIKSLYDYVIVKEVTVSDVTVRSYFIGAKDLEANWTNKTSLTYSTDIKGRKLINEGQNWLAANTGTTFTGLLDEYSGAAAAYSLRLLSNSYSGDAIVVRRSSDNATQSIGFVNNELDTAALTTFCNTPVNKYTSDFTVSENLTETNGIGSAANTIGGVSDAYKFELTGGSTSHIAILPAGTINENSTFDITFDYYIPSTNVDLDGIQLRTNNVSDGTFDQNIMDSWQTVNINNFTVTGQTLRIYALDSGSYTVNADGDVFYLKNITVTQTSAGANGYVTKWYDQSGNGYDVAQTIASAQPKICDSVNGVVLENGKPTIEFDGNKTFTTTATISNASDYYLFYVRNKTVAQTGYLLHSETGQLIIEVFEYAAYLDPVNSIEGTGILEGHKLVHFELNSTTGAKVYENSINTQTGLNYSQTAISGRTAIGGIFAGVGNFIGNIQELIIYNTNQSSNRTGIETNINNFYSIY